MSPKRRQDRNAFLVFVAIVPLALLVAPLPFLRVASENYAVNQRIARIQQQQRAVVVQPAANGPATGASAAQTPDNAAAER